MPVIRVQTVITGVGGAPAYNSLHFLGGEAEAGDAFSAAAAFWSSVRGVMSSAATVRTSGTVTILDTATGAIESEYVTADVVGNGAQTGSLPTMTQGLVRLRTGVFNRGRRVRGRINVPFPNINSDTGQGAPSTTYIAALNTAGSALVNDPDSFLVVYSRPRPPAGGGEGPLEPGLTTEVLTASAWNQWAVLRSRRD